MRQNSASRILSLVLIIFATCALLPCAAQADNKTGKINTDVLDVGIKTKVPSDETVNFALSRKTGGGQINLTSDPLMNGVNNTFYQHTIDMPLTKFVLGNVELNADGIKKVFDAENADRHSRAIQGSNSNNPIKTGQVAGLISYDLSGVSTINANAGKVFRFLMGPLGVILLVIMFTFQTVMIGYNGLLHDRGFSATPLPAVVFRFIIFLLAILFFRTWTGALITFSNYASDAIMPMGTQTHLMGTIMSAAATVSDGALTMGSLIGNFFRSLAYVCVKILIIMRDVLMALTLVTGTACIAFGSFSTYGNQEPMREYLSGWIKNFTTMLLWGPFASLVIYAMGVTSILTTAGEVSSVASGIFGLAALFAAKDIPRMSEEFGNVALASLIGMLAPAVNKMTVGGAGMMTVMVGGGLYRGARGGARKLRSISDSYAGPSIAATVGGGATPTRMTPSSALGGEGAAAGEPNGVRRNIAPTVTPSPAPTAPVATPDGGASRAPIAPIVLPGAKGDSKGVPADVEGVQGKKNKPKGDFFDKLAGKTGNVVSAGFQRSEEEMRKEMERQGGK